MSRDHSPIKITQFNGLFDRGEPETCPADHCISTQNTVFTHNGIETRKGFGNAILTLASVRRMAIYKRVGEVTRLILLDNSGNLYDSTDLVTPIITIPGMIEFSGTNFLGRFYFSPHNGETGLVGETLYVYDGTNCRAAGSSIPSGTLVAANSASSGSVDAGFHLFAVAFETDTGHISKPGPTIFASLTATGSLKVDLSGIPTGPSYIANRRILATKRITNFDGNQESAEYFFVPDGVVAGNVATTATVDFFDSQLLQSADYLFDQLATIPSTIYVGSYANRLAIGGAQIDPSLMRLSKVGDPESIDAVDGLLIVDPTEAGPITNGVDFRGSFYITKNLRFYMVTDNGFEPSFWAQPQRIDIGTGTGPFGIGVTLDARGANVDRVFLAGRNGLAMFDGSFSDPELSWKVRDIWKSITQSAFAKVQVVVDSVGKQIYIAMPTNGASEINNILVGDYQNGLNHLAIRWTQWDSGIIPTCLVMDVDNNNVPVLKVGSTTAGNVYRYNPATLVDNGSGIFSFVQFPYLPDGDDGKGWHIGQVGLAVRGSGSLQIHLSGLNGAPSYTAVPISLSSPIYEKKRLVNIECERITLQLTMSLFEEHFSLTKVVLYAIPVWAERPAE